MSFTKWMDEVIANYICGLHSVWPDDGIKSGLIPPKIAQKVAAHILHNSDIIWNSPKCHQNILATFMETICCQELVKMAQSGHTDYIEGKRWASCAVIESSLGS